MAVGLLTVGDELLAGETTNAAWLAGADRTGRLADSTLPQERWFLEI